MSKIRQILRLYSQGNSKLAINRLTGISRNTLKKYIRDYKALNLNIIEIEELSDYDLEELFSQFKQHQPCLTDKARNLIALFPEINKQLKRKGVTQFMLWEQYRIRHPDGLSSSQFSYYYAIWKQQVNPVMHVDHKVGDKLYVDYAGEKLQIVDPQTGELKDVEVFVAILGCSQLTYVEASYSQQKEDLIASCERCLHYIGGVPTALVTDNLKSAVTKSSKYEPIINEDFADFADHYSITVLPTRAYKPRDKSLVEGAVKIIYTRIYAKIRDGVYHSLAELNAAIQIVLEQHNNMLLKGRQYSRRQQFEEIERPVLNALAPLKYEFKQQHFATVMKNGHVCLGPDKHYYSVPYRYIGKKVKLLYSVHRVEVYYSYERIACHERLKSPYSYTTDKEHLASTHRFVSDWSPERFLSWAASIDQTVQEYIHCILNKKQHVEQAYKSCTGILAMAKRYGNLRLINACKRSIEYDMYSYRAIDMILKRGLDHQDETSSATQLMPDHSNIRGQHYYN
ncbi:MAG: IS21 family transposase [Sediminibacterium sp.]|nr:IS21 family transposase [Sediminibacterium sp.]